MRDINDQIEVLSVILFNSILRKDKTIKYDTLFHTYKQMLKQRLVLEE